MSEALVSETPGETMQLLPKIAQPLRKTIFDLVLAVLLLFALAIPLICIAVIIKCDSKGPVFFRQPRVGLNNRLFCIWKFRTMYHTMSDLHGVKLTERNDRRITRSGMWLRKWSIDEVPQIFNVLAGDMSLVGPRPHALYAGVGERLYGQIVPDYALRHAVKPGITGWAQVNGWRGETTTPMQIEQRVAHDIAYIENWSIWLDCKILLLTLKNEIRSERAF